MFREEPPWGDRIPDYGKSHPGLHAALLLLPFLLLRACSLPPSRIESPSAHVAGDPVSQTGIASWYGPGFQAKATASTAIYDQNELTAAHPTLPLGSLVLVTNLENGNSTEVIINDRGPFAKGRIIDLSFAAGKVLGMIRPGTVPVRLEVIGIGHLRIQSIPKSLRYTLQLGAFSQLDNANRFRDNLSQSQVGVIVVPSQAGDARYYRVQVGTFVKRSAAEERAIQLSQTGVPAIITEK